MEKLRVRELVIGEEVGVFALSFVENPATEAIDSVYLSENKVSVELKEDEKGLFYGVILRPNKLIARKDEQGKFFITFSKETVEATAHRFQHNQLQASITEEHQGGVEGITLVESWIVEDAKMDKSTALGITSQKGDWVGGFKIENEDMKEKIRAGSIKGISIEGDFVDAEVEASFLKKLKDLVN